jgi:hypothetical protein
MTTIHEYYLTDHLFRRAIDILTRMFLEVYRDQQLAKLEAAKTMGESVSADELPSTISISEQSFPVTTLEAK